MSTATVAATSPLRRTKWGDRAYVAATSLNPFFNLMSDGLGGSKMGGMFIREKFEAGAGDTKNYPFRALKVSNPVYGDQRVQGTGSSVVYANDSITLNRVREELVEYNTAMTELRTRVDVEGDISDELGRLSAIATARGIMTALLDVTAGRTTNRYQYGNATANYNASHTTSMANVTNANGVLTLEMLRNTAAKMKSASSGVGFMQRGNVVTSGEKVKASFIALLHPKAVLDLKADTNFANQVYVGQNDMFDVVTGSNYIGRYEGIDLYEFLPLDGQNDTLLVTGAGGSGINLAHNLILGANALVVGQGNVPAPKGNTKYSMSNNRSMMVTTVDDDHGGDAAWAYTKVEGYRKLVDNTVAGGEDFGVFHLFTRATAGY